jgi:STAS domain
MDTAPSRGVAILVGMTAAAPPPRSSTDGRDGTSAPETSDDDDPTSIRVATEGSTVVIAVAGELDITTGEALIDAAEAAVVTGPSRLDIDLRALEDFDEAGAGALVSCRQLGAQLAEGLHYRTGRGPGRDALLAAYSELEGEAVAE